MKLLIIIKYAWNKVNYRIVKLIIISILLVITNVVGQARDSALRFNMDFALFRLNEKKVYLEIYYSVPREDISHTTITKGYRGAFQIATQIITNDSLFLTDTLNIEDRVKSLEQISAGQKFAEISTFLLSEGSYLIKSELIDLVSKESVTISDSVQISTFSYDTLILSSVELASSISAQKVRERKYDKNGLRVIPNADRIYGKALPNLFFYAEAYNFAWDDDARKSPYQVNYKIKDMNGTKVLDLKGKKKNKPGKTSVIYGSINVSELTSGSYTFEVEVIDSYNMQLVAAKKQFFIFKKSDFIKKSNDVQKQIAHIKYEQMDEDQLDTYFKQLNYIANKDEKKVYKQLSLEGKRNFFISFWNKRDPDPTTSINESEIQYNNLLKIANERFSYIFKQGWETDRGRVLLLYGLPDTKDVVPASTDTKAYEIWYYYNIEGGVEFVFVDKKQNGSYELVHSTKRGEISDPDWRINYARL